jgi:hypothetical protein
MASERKKSNSKGRSTSGSRSPAADQHYAICVRNDDYPASLELRKLYPLIEDAFASQHGMVRVVDESGEDYLYPSEFFVRLDLPASVEKALAKIA